MLKSLLTTIFLSCFFLLPSFVDAGTSHNIVGWAWSSNIGWISFNCTNTSSCGSVDYGVNKNVDGTITGYAWSSNIGWIQFGGLSAFPLGGGNLPVDAQMSGSSLIGYAQALGYTGGLISFSGTNYGVTLIGNTYGGYAWNSWIIGWIHFDAAGADGVRVEADPVSLDAQISGLSIEGTTVSYNSDVTFQYVIGSIGAHTCSLSKTSAGGSSFTPLSGIVASGSATTGALLTGSYTFELLCTNGMSKTVSFDVGAQPAGFTLGSSEDIKIVFATPGMAESESKTIAINSVGGFTGDVTISIGSISPALPVGTTALYSFNGGAFSASPSVTIPYNSSASLKVQISQKITSPYIITLTGSSAGFSDSTKQYTIVPTTVIPKFEEY